MKFSHTHTHTHTYTHTHTHRGGYRERERKEKLRMEKERERGRERGGGEKRGRHPYSVKLMPTIHACMKTYACVHACLTQCTLKEKRDALLLVYY